jgi:exodeoxyribonuclease V alpha subunit
MSTSISTAADLPIFAPPAAADISPFDLPDDEPMPAPATAPTADPITRSEITATVLDARLFGDPSESCWAVLTLNLPSPSSKIGTTACGEVDADSLVNETGSSSPVIIGMTYRLFGRWDIHEKHGRRFLFDAITPSQQTTQAGITAFLSRSGLGLTANDAGRIFRRFGAKSIDVLRETPKRIADECGVNLTIAEQAASKLSKSSEIETAKLKLFEMFAGRGFNRKTVSAAIRTWGERAPEVIRRDPFKMLVAGLPGVGFKRADKMYTDLGYNPARLKRIMLAGWHWMSTNGTGNTWEFRGTVLRQMLIASIQGAPSADVAEELLAKALVLGLRSRWLEERIESGGIVEGCDLDGIVDTSHIAEASKAGSERRLADHVKRITSHKPIWPTLTAGEFGVSDHQAERAAAFKLSALAILAGTPGTGKTFTAAALLRKLLESLPSGQIAVAAPTGKAAVRITAAMQRYNLPLVATTIHRLLGVASGSGGKWKFQHNERNPLKVRVVVVDESSMIDTDLAAALFAAIPPGGNVLLLGDPYQLPPVGHGAPLRDLIASGVACGMLSEIKRNSGRIVSTCAAIKDGQMFDPSPKFNREAGENLLLFPADSPELQRDGIVTLLGTLPVKLGFDATWDCQVLVATNDKSEVSRKQLNTVLQDVLNPVDPDIPVEYRNPKYRKGDKIICLSNTEIQAWEPVSQTAPRTMMSSWKRSSGSDNGHFLANGDMGRVEAVDGTSIIATFFMPDRTVKIKTQKKKQAGDEREDESGEFDLAYAITVHKSQGSEWPVAIVVLDPSARMLTSREWIYTAVSRAGELCVLVGKIGNARKMALRPSLDKRKTFLRELISSALPE